MTTKTCSKCNLELSVEKFAVTKREGDRIIYRNSWCNKCRAAQNRERNGHNPAKQYTDDPDSGLKQCRMCMELKSFSLFSEQSRGKYGISSRCKPCTNDYARTDVARSNNVKATAKYRDVRKYRWRANHRITQAKRRGLIKVTSDGSVTDDFLKSVYESELCYWCKEFIPEEDRTLEHIKELCSGGEHVASNITMACNSCNCKRLNKER